MYQSKLDQARLGLKLIPIRPMELTLFEKVPGDIYAYMDGLFKKICRKSKVLNKQVINDLIIKGNLEIFILEEDYGHLLHLQRDRLRRVTRALSIGDPLDNGKLQAHLLSMNMKYLYRDPFDGLGLELQFQSVSNLSSFLLKNNREVSQRIFQEVIRQNHHFTVAQPLLSSILLLSYLKYTQQFSEKEMEGLFVASYFKDIGMAVIPSEILEKDELNEKEKRAFLEHPIYSVSIIEGRIPINNTYLKIIENHHISGQKISSLGENTTISDLMGIETVLVDMSDRLMAMISERPFREKLNLYSALELISKDVAKDYPKEFRYLVRFAQKFFSNKR